MCQRLINTRKAFTMVEMFVVLGGIAVLSVIVIPALGILFRQSYKAQDASNLKNLGVQQQKWSDQRQGKLPPLFFTFPENAEDKLIVMTVPRDERESGWDAFEENLFKGPADAEQETVPLRLSDGSIENKIFSYGVNVDLLARKKLQHNVTNPSGTVYMFTGSISGMGDNPSPGAEVNTYDNALSYVQSALRARHSGIANVLFMDGHVEPRKELTTDEVNMD